jgi:REP element-mobilizing transposase RayT
MCGRECAGANARLDVANAEIIVDAPLAYFITFTCYGTWLHGDERGSVDVDHNASGTPLVPPDRERHGREQNGLAEAVYCLDVPRRQVTLEAMCEIARRKAWTLHAVHVRSNHVHVVVTAPGEPERVMNDLKTAASRRLNKAFPAERDRTRWTRHGSTRYLWTEEAISEKVHYVVHGQGEPMARFPEPDADPSGADPSRADPSRADPSRARSAAE